jgi:hypothetical protein
MSRLSLDEAAAIITETLHRLERRGMPAEENARQQARPGIPAGCPVLA